MKATFLDFRKKPGEIIRALESNESVILLYRGKVKGTIQPAGAHEVKTESVTSHEAFGMWKERDDMKKVKKVIRRLREGQNYAV